ncbi:MAG: SapC family protein [Pseudomonadota bacterium]
MTDTDVLAQPLPGVSNLPLCYGSLTPLVAQRHGALRYKAPGRYDFSATVNAVPLLAEEFPRAQGAYPIVFTSAEPHLPVALLGHETGRNEFVDADGTWRKDTYVPAYLRRYPFALVSEKEGSDRMLLCADVGASGFCETGPDPLLFDGDQPSETATRIIDFCKRYEESLQRTRAMVRELSDLGLLEDSTVRIARGGVAHRVEGFRMISETKMRALDDAPLASLARRGVIGLASAHIFSTQRFSDLVLGEPQ